VRPRCRPREKSAKTCPRKMTVKAAPRAPSQELEDSCARPRAPAQADDRGGDGSCGAGPRAPS
jgi:hypothetical protein